MCFHTSSPSGWQSWLMTNDDVLTSDLQRGVPTDGVASLVSGHTPVHASVLFLLPMHDPQEEQGPSRQQDAVRLGIRRWSTHRFTVFEPLYCRLWLPLRLAIQRHGFVLRYYHVRRVFCDPRCPVLTYEINRRVTVRSTTSTMMDLIVILGSI